jgi:hypothetical protein
MTKRVSDYLAMGVETIWILDPVHHKAWIAIREGFEPIESESLTVPLSPARIDLHEVFNKVDRLFSGRW